MSDTTMSPEAALQLLHDGKVHSIMWNATPEHIERDKKMSPGRTTIYMTCPFPGERTVKPSD